MEKTTLPEAFENFINFFDKEVEKAKFNLQLAKNIANDLLTKLPKIKKHFKEYDPTSVQHFVETYAHDRHRFTKSADHYQLRAEEITCPFLDESEERLKWIQQKKLFNLQCLWRAGKIQLEGVETTYDILQWENNLYNCPFLPPITEEEVELLVRFLKDTPVEEQSG
ncbi:MAG TPA: hypothetical protein VF411_03290, partial [Bacteroidia bacterium]